MYFSELPAAAFLPRTRMPIFVLYAKADLEGVKKLTYPYPGCTWKCDVKQGAGDEERKGVILDPEEQNELTDGKNGVANFVVKFPGDKKQSSLVFLSPSDKDLEKKKVKIRNHQTEDDTDMVPILAMECRGLEPVRWYPTGPYEAEASSGVTYDGVQLDEGDDWCDYDEKSGDNLLVGHEIKYEFRRI